MIKGMGVDVVDISRLEQLIEKYGRHFLDKVFTEQEKAYCGAMARPAVHYAGRWAVKEAFYKALPPQCQKMSGFKSIETITGGSRAPAIRVCDEKLGKALAANAIASMRVSISHEKNVCVAFVIME